MLEQKPDENWHWRVLFGKNLGECLDQLHEFELDSYDKQTVSHSEDKNGFVTILYYGRIE